MDEATFTLYAKDMRDAAELAARIAGCLPAEAEDVASDTMLALWQMHPRLDAPTCVAYARMAARHKALNTFRGQHPLPASLENLGDVEGRAGPSPEELMISREDTDWFLAEIDRLPSTQQTILRLRQVELLENSEIALCLGIAETSVATLLSRARKTMYNAIKERMKR